MFYVLTSAFAFAEAAILPPLARQAPGFVEGFLGIYTGTAGSVPLATLEAIYGGVFVLYLLGGLLLGIAFFRARVLARPAAILLAAGTVSTLLIPVLPHAVGRYAAVPVGLAVAWLGVSLVTEQHEQVTVPSAVRQPPFAPAKP